MRIGNFTGKIYDEDYDFSKCQECCTCLSTEQVEDESFIAKLRVKNKLDCITCMRCPAAKSCIV